MLILPLIINSMVNKLIFSLLFATNLMAAQEGDWATYAIYLSSNPQDRILAKEYLQKMPQLKDKLRMALLRKNLAEQELALDVITALKYRQLQPELKNKIQSQLPESIEWKWILALNSTIEIDDARNIVPLYESLLKNKKFPPSSIIEVLNGLNKVGHQIHLELMKQLMSSGSIEVKEALLQSLGNYQKNFSTYSEIIFSGLSSETYQLRQLSYDTAIKNKDFLKKNLQRIKSFCLREKRYEILKLCKEQLEI